MMTSSSKISANDLKALLGLDSQIYQNFGKKWQEIKSFPEIQNGFITWTKQYPFLHEHLDQKSQKNELFKRNSYFIWILSHFLKQIFPTFTLTNEFLTPFSFLNDHSDKFLTELKGRENKKFVSIDFHDFGNLEMFGPLLNQLVELETQEEKGMFFTTPLLAQFVVSQVESNGAKILEGNIIDPTCGTGSIILHVLKSLLNITQQKLKNASVDVMQIVGRLYGIDENPAALFATLTNLILFLAREFPTYTDWDSIYSLLSDHFICRDLFTLAESSKPLNNFPKFDIAMGNLPWNVINNLRNPEMRLQTLALAKQYHLFMSWKNQANLEIATILWEIIRQNLVTNTGQLAFLLPASLLTASQHALFRQFSGLQNIESYSLFPDFFPIHSMLLIAQKTIPNTILNEKKDFQARCILSKTVNFNLETNSWEISEPTPLNPAYVRYYRKHPYIGKYIAKTGNQELIPIQKSPYYSLVHRGVDITPRKLLFVSVLDNTSDRIPEGRKQSSPESSYVVPDLNQISSTHSQRWNSVELPPTYIETKYLFSVVKSTNLVPFQLSKPYTAFLPFKREYSQYTPIPLENLSSLAQTHWQKITQIYQENRSPSSKNTTLMENLCYGKKIFNPALCSPLKVLYPVGGSNCKAAILREPDWMIDVTFYYLSPANEDEAYYLLAWLNSSLLKKNLYRVCTVGANGSIRVIHLAPWQFPLPLFTNSVVQQKIVQLGKKMETFVVKILKHPDFNSYTKNPLKTPSLAKIYKFLANSSQYQTFQAKLTHLFLALFNLS